MPAVHTHRVAKLSPMLIAFVTLYMLVFSALALRQGNTEFLMYAVVMLVFIAIILVLNAMIRFTPAALWLLALWGFLHMAGGTIPIDPALTDAYRAADDSAKPTAAVLYSLRFNPDLPRYDQLIHTLGFFAATIACHQALTTLLRAPRTLPTAIAAALMGMGLGALNEVIEFIAVLTMPQTNVGGYTNTAWDLVSNTVGAVSAACVCFLKRN